MNICFPQNFIKSSQYLHVDRQDLFKKCLNRLLDLLILWNLVFSEIDILFPVFVLKCKEVLNYLSGLGNE